MTNRKYNPNQSTKPMLIEFQPYEVEDSFFISLLVPQKCPQCHEWFERGSGYKTDDDARAFCGKLCSFRHKKRKFAAMGIIVR